MSNRIRIGIIGAKGRMGSAIARLIGEEFAELVEVGALIDKDNAAELTRLAPKVDVFVDVSTPRATTEFLGQLEKTKLARPFVIGATGWDEPLLAQVRAYAERVPVVLAPNFSPGVTLFLGLLGQAAPILSKWGYDAVVHETHHTKKLDSPSGTAKAIVELLAPMKAQVHASRAGNIIGTHEVRFVGPSDIISFTHEALDRSIFARGAVMAAQWTARQPKPGLYSMKDVVFG